MPWQDKDRWNMDIYETVHRLIALRHEHSALRRGAYQQIAATETSYAFIREDESERVFVAVNSGEDSDSITVELTAESELLFAIGNEPSIDLSDLTLPARSAAIWRTSIG